MKCICVLWAYEVMCKWVQAPKETRGEVRIAWSWSYRCLWPLNTVLLVFSLKFPNKSSCYSCQRKASLKKWHFAIGGHEAFGRFENQLENSGWKWLFSIYFLKLILWMNQEEWFSSVYSKASSLEAPLPPKGPCAKGVVSSLWSYREAVEHLEEA